MRAVAHGRSLRLLALRDTNRPPTSKIPDYRRMGVWIDLCAVSDNMPHKLKAFVEVAPSGQLGVGMRIVVTTRDIDARNR